MDETNRLLCEKPAGFQKRLFFLKATYNVRKTKKDYTHCSQSETVN